jgi:hypothetical protein
MDTSYYKEQPKKQEYVAGSNKVKEEVNGNSSTDIVNSGSGPDYQICIPLGWAPW